MGVDELLDDNFIQEQQNASLEDSDIENKDEEEIITDTIVSDEELAGQPKFDMNNESVLKYINETRKSEVATFEDLFKEVESKEVIKEINPFEDVFDEHDKSYFQFKKDTGLGRKEFDFVQQDISTKSSLDLAFEKVRKDNGGTTLSNEQITAYLEKKLNIDLDGDEIDSADEIELNSFVKKHREELTAQQEKYKVTENPKKETVKEDMVTLENGEQMPKAKYEELNNQRTDYINNLKEGVSSATSFDVEFAFDNNGEKQTSKFNYEYTDDDRHSMVSNASDVNNFIAGKFRTDKGFDYKGLAEFIHKAENTDKYLALAYNQGRAEMLEEKISGDNNEEYSRITRSSKQPSNGTIDDLISL